MSRSPDHPFADNVVVLTGASMGIGEQLAYQLADQRALLVLTARSEQRLQHVADECRKRGGQASVFVADLTEEAACQQLIEHSVRTYGRIDTLLYNAGRGYPARFDTLPDLSSIRREITLNYLGLVGCTYYALPYLKQTRGRLVAVSSFGSFAGIAGTAGYNASKHALRGFLNTLRAELLGSGVTVTVAVPGAIRTDRLRETMGDNLERVPSMSPERCAEQTIRAAAHRRRQLVMTAAGKVLYALYPFLSKFLDQPLARVMHLYKTH